MGVFQSYKGIALPPPHTHTPGPLPPTVHKKNIWTYKAQRITHEGGAATCVVSSSSCRSSRSGMTGISVCVYAASVEKDKHSY